MEQEDYFKRQIDQLGRVLGKILADLTDMHSGGGMGGGIEVASQALKGELGLDLDELEAIPEEQFIETLAASGRWNDENLDNLASLFVMIAEESENNRAFSEKALKRYERTLCIYQHLDQVSHTYSIDRHRKVLEVRQRMKNRKS